MTPRRHRLALLATLALAGSLLTACTASPAADPTAAPSATAPAAASPSAEAEPAPETTPEAAAAATCETVLTPEATAEIAADGLTPVETTETFYPFADDLVEAGALLCRWGKPSSDVGMLVVQLSGVAATDWADELAAAGYVQTDDPVAGAHTGPIDGGTGLPSVVVVEADRLTFVSAPDFVDDLA
ncbi:hypothetical protein [Agromyces sp. NPDC058110]|uniref:hypothetical protein n=1 Tax=Agromyces sp. NPDC058110 TaxID=3346345 RepID=UPI0036DD2837